MNDTKTSTKRGPKATGSLVWTKSGWAARVPGMKDGERVKLWFPLGTESKAIARRKLARIVAGLAKGDAPAPADTRNEETVSAYAESWLTKRETRGVRSAPYERFIWKTIWQSVIGTKALSAVTAADVRAVLDDLASGAIAKPPSKKDGEPGRYSRQSIAHMRAMVFRLFQAAWKDEIIPENRVARVEVPEVDEEKKPRAILTDTEMGTLVAHPAVDPEIKILVLLSRTIGGLRAGDLNALSWQAFGPEFATCTFVRRKTRKKRPMPQTLEVPAPIRPFIAAWWDRQEKPEAGPVFPVRKGPRAGQQKKASNMSYADRLRRELVRAGITRTELHAETPTTLPVDFHSTRRAYATALARVGVNEQTAMVLTGHTDPKVHQRYVEAASIRALPAAAVPTLSAEAIRTLAVSSFRKARRGGDRNASASAGLQCRRSDLNRRPHAYEADLGEQNEQKTSPTVITPAAGDDPQTATLDPLCPVSVSGFALDARLADHLLGVALRGLADRAVRPVAGSAASI